MSRSITTIFDQKNYTLTAAKPQGCLDSSQSGGVVRIVLYKTFNLFKNADSES